MNKEYAQKFNILLQHFHFNKESAGYSFDASLEILQQGIFHLLNASMLLGDSDARTLSRLSAALRAVESGEVPKPQEIHPLKERQARSDRNLLPYVTLRGSDGRPTRIILREYL
ncbi:MAG: hypothetical protein P0Y63_24740 [Klebsiella huaxiensis]|uniref:hypothetical protein n=1 Tax=Klebsiella huaxiensis TaxID=2153354 RepID=UPI0026EEBAE4|nr:hypothetical protein [Klebsiella huaxiensis]WEJ88454.1 MAG: hypothetical protein P0Y63_24740 [Klebsiella huaxiensis]